MQLKGKKILVLSTVIVYCVSFLLQSGFSLLQTRAQETNIPRVNVVAVLVDDKIYNQISDDLERYTKNYVQQQLFDTKALVMPLNLDNISAYDIYRMMENIYFDWLENVNSSLIWLIMVWNIPLPVVNQNWYVFPTVYPYVDFENQKYVRDSDSNYFISNWNAWWQAEIRHWLIDYGDDIQAYSDFFQKVKTYSQNPDGFIWDSMWYEDFIANKEWFVDEYFQYYKNKIMFGEDLSYQRYSPLMSKIMWNYSLDTSVDILTNIQNSAGVVFSWMDSETINSLKSQWDSVHTTKIVEQEVKDSYLADYNELFSKIWLSRMRENIFAWWRWIKNSTDSYWQKIQVANADNSASMIQLKDTLYLWTDNFQWLIENLNELMENMVDKKVEDEKYSMDIVLPVELEIRTGKRAYIKCFTFVDRFENYYFGRDARYINDPKDLSIYRWTYRNLKSLDGVTYNSLLNWYNPPISQYENTNFRLRSIWASYDIFSTQVEWNRWYNSFLVSDDLDEFDANKERALDEEKTNCVQGLCTVRRKYWPVNNCGKNDNKCEDIYEFSTRWWWGASAINVESWSVSNWTYRLSGYKATDSWRPIFDMWWFRALLPWNESIQWWTVWSLIWPQKAATSFEAYRKYSSPTERDWWQPRFWGYIIYNNHMPDQHISFSNLDYWALPSAVLYGVMRNDLTGWNFYPSSESDKMFTVYGRSFDDCWSSRKYTYKFLSSIIKHDSTSDLEINWVDYDKYWENWEIWKNNTKIIGAYQSVLSSITWTLQDYWNIIDTLSGNKQIMQSWTWINPDEINNALSQMNVIADYAESVLSDLYAWLNSLVLDEILGAYDWIISDLWWDIEYYSWSYNSTLPKIPLLPDWISGITWTAASIRTNWLNLIDMYNAAIQSIQLQISLWNVYANNWKVHVSDELIDSISNKFNNDMFIIHIPEEEVTADMTDEQLKEFNKLGSDEKAEMLTIDFTTVADSYNVDFLNSYTEVGNIFSNIKKDDTVWLAIITGALTDINFVHWISDNHVQINTYAELITMYAKWSIDKGIDGTRFSNHQDMLEWVIVHEDWMNLLTSDRPIDSPRYISMQSIAWNEINLIYPDLFKVEVFWQSGQNNGLAVHNLLTKPQIKENLIRYLSWKADEYNTILMTEYNNAPSDSGIYYKRLSGFNVMATPNKNVRPYNYFTYDEFVEALWWTWMLDVVVDILYYQNLTNTKKLSSDSISKDIDLIKKSFNINDKRAEVLKDYLTQWNEQSKNIALVIPTYQISWYEVAYVNSNWKDYIISDEWDSSVKVVSTSNSSNSDENWNNPANNQNQDECNIPLDWVLPLIKLDWTSPSSPWYQWVKCWLKNLDVKVKITFDSSVWAIFDRWITWFLSDTFAEPFTSWRSNAESWWNEVKESYSNQQITEMQMDAENHNQSVVDWSDWISNAFATFSANVKISSSNLTLSDNNPVSELKISSITDIWNVTVVFSSTWDGCLKVDDDSLCSWNLVSRTFNPKTNPSIFYISSADHIAWSVALDLKFQLGWDYIEKVYKYKVSPSDLDVVYINAGSDKTVAGMATPIEIVGYDKYNNRVSRWLTNYDFIVSTWELSKDWVYQTWFTTNDFRDLKFYYRAPAWAVNNSEALIQIKRSKDATWYLATHRQTIVQWFPEISLDGSVVLSDNVIRTGKSMRLTSSENIYNDLWKLDVSKLHTMVINVKGFAWNIIDVNSQIKVTSKRWLIVLGQVYKNADWEDAFYQTSKSYMSGGVATVYYYPTTVAWDDIITINIPWLENRVIDLSVLPSTWVNTQILLESNVLNLWDTMDVEILLSDKWWNLVDWLNKLPLLYDSEQLEFIVDGVVVEPVVSSSNGLATVYNAGSGLSWSWSLSWGSNWIFGIGGGLGIKWLKWGVNFDVNNWYSKIQIHGIWAWLSYIAWGNSYAEVTVDKHLFPTSWLNIMYLNYFGDDWGNQWWYFSNNNKYIEWLMKDSNKIITTTTQLISEEKIKRIVWKIDPWFRVWNPDNTSTLMILKDGKFNIKIWWITNMVSDLPSLNWMSLNESTIESILWNSNSSKNNYAFFVSNSDNYSISDGILYSGAESIWNILDWEISLLLTQNTIFGDNVWSIVDNWVNYWSLIFHYPSFIPDWWEFSIPWYRYIINPTFTRGSTFSMLSIWIFDSQSSFELDSSYTSIQDSINTDESIGFQGDFKNITLFAEWEIVGEATRKFGSEFVINLWDPLLSRKSNNENVYGTNYDGGLGQEIYSDSENDISSTHEIDFNNDGLKDLLVVYLDWSIKLSKNYGSNPNLRNMQEIMRIAIPIKDVYVWDVDGNNYEDIILRTQNNQIRVYLNHDGIFDVDWNIACLNLNVYEWEVSDTPSDLSWLFQFFIEDMDMDNILDFVTYDYKWYIKIFYGWTTNWYSNYLSTEKYACDTWWYDRQISNTKIVAAFWANVTSERVYDDSMIRRVWMVKPEITVSESELSDFWITIDTGSLESKITAKDRDNDVNITPLIDEVMNNFDVNKASEQYVNKALKYQEVSLYENELVWWSWHMFPFVPISYLTPDSVGDKAAVWKNYSVKNGGSILADGDIVTVTVTIQARQSFVWSFWDIIQWPWKLYFDDDNIFEWIEFISNQKNAVVKKRDGNFAYLIDNISLNAWETMVFKYDLEYAATPLRKMDISYRTFWSDDDLPDIKMQPVDWCAKDFDAFVNSGSREFEKQTILLQDMIDSVYEDMGNDVEDPSEQVSWIWSDVSKIPWIVPNSIHRESLLWWIMPFDGELNGASIVNSLFSEWWISLNLDISLLDDVAEKVTNAIDDLAKWMCNGFSFGWSNNCQWLPVPFNQAFLAPGKYNLFGCIDLPLWKLEDWVPIFNFPGTLIVPPVWPMMFPWWQEWDAGDEFLWAPWWTYPSFIRIYAAPTLTLQLWIAICMSPEKIFSHIPSPISDIWGNCIVFAIKPQCKKKENKNQDNPVETYSPIVEEIRDSGPCQLSQKWPMVTKRWYRSSAIDLYSYSVGSSNSSTPSFNSWRPLSNWANGFASNRSSFSAGETMWTVTPNGNWWVNNWPEFDVDYLWIISLETNASVGYFDESWEPNSMSAKNSIMIWNVDILWWDFSINKIRWWIQQWLRKAIIDKWLDPQIRYIVNQLTKMHITVKLPNFDSLISSEKAAWWSIVNDFWSMMNDDFEDVKKYASGMANAWKKQSWDTFSKWSERTSNSMRDFNASISNPFESLASLMNQSEIFNISTETLTVKVPMIYPEDISSYWIYLQQWADSNTQIIEDWRNAIEAFSGSCAKESNQTKKEKCYEDAKRALASLVEFESWDWEKMLNQIYVDLQILQEYRNFPFEMYERIHVIDRYMSEIMSLISNTVGYLSYRMVANEERFVWYVDAIILIIDIIKTYQMIIDFSIEWWQSCGNCSEDTYDQYSCKLSILCDLIQIPVIQIPNFKIPNITLDLSNIDLWLNIILPKFNFQPIKIELPEIPNLPEPPSVWIDIKLFDLPDIPQLPEPPDLPELPSFIPQIEIELPMLPPAPELPRIPNTIEVAIDTAKYIWKIYCIVKSSFGLVWEKATKAKIEQITERTYEVKWIDTIMNFTNLMEAPIKNYWVDYEISSYVNLQFNFNDFYNFMDTVTKQINNLSTAVQSWFQYASSKMQDANNDLQGVIDWVDGANVNVNMNVNTNLGYVWETSDDIDYVDYVNAKGRLKEVLSYFKKNTDNSRFEDTFNSSIKKIENQINTPSKIEANLVWIQNVENEIMNYLKDTNTEYSQLADLINNDYEWFLAMVDNQNKGDTITVWESEKLLTFNVQLFNMDGSTKETLMNLKDQNPYVDLLDNKKEIVDWYWNAIITNTPDSLWLSQSQYLVLRDNIWSMKKQVATMYSLVRPVQSTSLLAKDTSTAVQKTMVAANWGSLWWSTEAWITVDPQAFTQWIYEEITSWTGAWERLVKVVYSDSFAENIWKKYYATNHLQNHDIILRTDNAVYKKCMNQSCSDWWNHFNWYYMHRIENIPYEETWISFDSETKLKIADKKEEVKNFKVDGQTYDDLTFSWLLDDVDAYLIKLVERVDYSYEKADYTDNSVRVRYVLAVPKWIDLGTLYKNDIKLELLNNRIDLIKDIYSWDLVEIVEYDVHKLWDVTISNIERKWYYIRIAALELNWDTYNISSPWSNQIVAWRQIVWDDLSPTWKAELYRPTTSEVVSEWNDLKWYVWTRYKLNVNWDDNVALSYINISKDGNILSEKYTSEMEDTVSVDISMHTQETDEIFYSVWIDQFGNKTEKVITVTYNVPGISIIDVSENSDWETASVVAELSQDVDQWNVSFQRRRWNVRKTMKRKDMEYADVAVWPRETIVKWGPYTMWNDIAMYDKNDELMALINPKTAEIKIQSGYQDFMDVKVIVQNSAVLQLYNRKTNNIVFSIALPMEKLIKIEADGYTVKDLSNDGWMWMFNWWKAVYRDWENVLFISPTGHLYSELALEWTYDYDRELQTIVLTVYQLSDLQKKNPIKVRLRVQPFVAL